MREMIFDVSVALAIALVAVVVVAAWTSDLGGW